MKEGILKPLGFFPLFHIVFVLKVLLNSIECVCGKKVNWPLSINIVVVILNDSQKLLSNI